MPGQLKSLARGKGEPAEPVDPKARIEQANAAARMEPRRDGYINAVQVYPFAQGALYQVYASPGEITDIALQDGEQLVGSGPVAAGDTVRWVIGDTESGSGAAKKIHIMVKPTRADLMTNLVINTDRRTYHLELRSTEKTYMASVSWQYPQDELIALRRQNVAAEAAAPVDVGLDLANLNFRYAIEGDAAPWRPTRAFDDGRKVYIEFPRGIAQGEMPPLFVIGAAGDSQLVNYRVRGNHYDRRSAVRRRGTALWRRLPEGGSDRAQRREAGDMSAPEHEKELAKELRLHPERPQVTRLSRRVLIALSGVSVAAMLWADFFALQQRGRSGSRRNSITPTRRPPPTVSPDCRAITRVCRKTFQSSGRRCRRSWPTDPCRAGPTAADRRRSGRTAAWPGARGGADLKAVRVDQCDRACGGGFDFGRDRRVVGRRDARDGNGAD